MEFVNQWLLEHKGYKKVSGSEHEELLVEMNKKGYVQLTAAPNGSLYYTKEDLEKARMWEEKLK